MDVTGRILKPDLQIENTVDALLEARLEAGGSVWLFIASQSMYPALLPGDRVLVRAARFEELRAGDIVVVKTDQCRLVHRLVDRRILAGELRLITKGDNCRDGDNPWQAGQLLGLVIARERRTVRLDLRSERAKSAGGIAALLSRGQWQVHRRLRGAQQRAFCRLFGLAMHGVIVLANKPSSRRGERPFAPTDD